MLIPALNVSAEQKWNEYKSAHFLIYYRSIPMDFIKTVESAAEDHYRAIAKGLGFNREENWVSDKRAKIFIYQDANDYTVNGDQQQWSHGSALASQKTIRRRTASSTRLCRTKWAILFSVNSSDWKRMCRCGLKKVWRCTRRRPSVSAPTRSSRPHIKMMNLLLSCQLIQILKDSLVLLQNNTIVVMF